MATDPITGAGQQQTYTSQASNKLSADYQSFLKLLTAQLSNQDPLAPMDSSTFVTQLAQLSQVEQAITTNTNLQTISTQLANSAMLADMQLIGRTVTVPGSNLKLDGGSAGFDYILSAPAAKVSAEILAEDGTVVRKLDDLPTGADKMQHVDWDGLDKVGLPVPDGAFKVRLKALDTAGEEIATITYGTALVERMSLEAGVATLHLDTGGTAYSAQVIAVQ